MVLREAMTLVAGGALVGVPLALAGTRLLRSQLFGVGTVDPPRSRRRSGSGAVRRSRGICRRLGRRGWGRSEALRAE